MNPKLVTLIPIDKISLDLENPRLGADLDVIGSNERKLQENLMKKDSILPLAESFAERGWVSDRLLIVYEKEKKGSYIVLEGNRRLLALKLLANPASALIEKEKYKSLSEKMKEKITEVPCVIYESREDASRLISNIHTKNDVKKWDIYAQGKFYHDQLMRSDSLDNFLKKFSLSKPAARKSIFLFLIIDHIKKNRKLSIGATNIFERGSAVASTLEKLLFLNSNKFNIEISTDFKKLKITDKKIFNKKLEKLIPMLKDRKITTRSYDSWTDKLAITKFIDTLSDTNPEGDDVKPENDDVKPARKSLLADGYGITEPKRIKFKKIYDVINNNKSITQKNLPVVAIFYFILFEIVTYAYLKEKKVKNGKKGYYPLSEMIKSLKKYANFKWKEEFYSAATVLNKTYNAEKHDVNINIRRDDLVDIIEKTASGLSDMIDALNEPKS